MEIREINGNLIKMAANGEFTAISHGCNAFHTMGSGIAPQINAFTNGSALRADEMTPYGDVNKLGTFSHVVAPIGDGQHVLVYNLYTQHTFAIKGLSKRGFDKPVYVQWNAVERAITAMLYNVRSNLPAGRHSKFTIGLPLIGCGLAQGKKDDFMATLHRVAEANGQFNAEIVVVNYDGS